MRGSAEEVTPAKLLELIGDLQSLRSWGAPRAVQSDGHDYLSRHVRLLAFGGLQQYGLGLVESPEIPQAKA